MSPTPLHLRRSGSVLVGVLLTVVAVSALVLALLFTTTLDLLAARARLRAVVLTEALETALQLAAAELALLEESGAPLPSPGAAVALGPWPPITPSSITVTLAQLEAPSGERSLLLSATSSEEPWRSPEQLLLTLPPNSAQLRRWRPP